MNFDNTYELCSYLPLGDLYNILNSDVNVFDKYAVSKMMNKKKNNMSNYDKLCFFNDNPEIAVKLFNFRSLCNQMFRCIKRSEFIDYLLSEFFCSYMPEEYDFPFIIEDLGKKRCYNLLSKIIRRFPGLVSYIDDKVFGHKYFIRDFTIWKQNDEFVYNKIMKYVQDKHIDLYEEFHIAQCMESDEEYNTDDEYDTDDDYDNESMNEWIMHGEW